MSALFEFLPLALFLAGYAYKGLQFAVMVLMIAMPISLGIKYLRTRTLDKMMFWSTVLLLVFGGLTLYFENRLFFFWKPTVFYWAAAVVFLASQFIGDRPLAQRFFGLMKELDLERITRAEWRNLNFAWIAFFIIAGLLNIYVAYNFSEGAWVKFKVFGLMALTFAFIVGQTFWIVRKTARKTRHHRGRL